MLDKDAYHRCMARHDEEDQLSLKRYQTLGTWNEELQDRFYGTDHNGKCPHCGEEQENIFLTFGNAKP